MSEESHDKRLFWGCFMALIATAFGFVVRGMVMGDWAEEFKLDATQQGQIFGVGLWPFAISIVLFSLIIDKIGYGRAMAFAFICHAGSAVMTITAKSYDTLYWATFIAALGNGTVEAVINPVVATVFKENKTKWLNILHAGWPGGLVIGGLLALAATQFGDGIGWQVQVGLVLIPTVLYGVMLFGQKFPVHERVEAGVSYLAMLKEVGILGALIIVGLMIREIGTVMAWSNTVQIAVIVVLVGAYGAYVRSLGSPLFIFLLIIMIPLATTELGTDSWITPLMEGSMAELNLPAVSVLIYTSFIMMVLRFMAGPIVEKLSPLGLLAASAVIAALGLVALSKATGIAILLAATLYAFGKTFFWPTMLGVVAERFPKGGAMTINTIAGVGMLSVGIIGAAFLGNIQDKSIDNGLQAYDAANSTALHEEIISPESKTSVFGTYQSIDPEKLDAADEETQTLVGEISEAAKKNALATVAIFPCFMFVCYMILILYFRSQGGYKAIHLDH